MAQAAYQAIVFDVGGVLVELGGVAALQKMLERPLPEDVMWTRWLTASPWVRLFESGQCTPEAFATGMVAEWQLQVTPEAFLENFRSWPTRLLPGVNDLLSRLAPRWTLACLSNTNSVHWPHVRDTLGLQGHFQRLYLSHEMGRLKPDRAAFEHVVDDLGCAPATILFFDDNLLNVHAAQEVGLHAHCAAGVAEVQAILHRLGILPEGAQTP